MSGAAKHSAEGAKPGPSARRPDQTLGEWLEERIAAGALDRTEERATPVNAPGGAEPTRISEALERLAQRLDSHERRSALGAADLDRTVRELGQRVHAAESGQSDAAARLFGAVHGLERAQAALLDRLTLLERDGAPGALARLETRTKAIDASLSEARAEAAGLKEAFARLAQAAEESVEDLTKQVAEARQGPQAALDSLSRELNRHRKSSAAAQAEISERLDALSATAVRSEDLATLRAQSAAMAERHEAALNRLTVRLDALGDRREDLDQTAQLVSDSLRQFAARLEQTEALPPRVEGLESALAALRTHLESGVARAESLAEAARAEAAHTAEALEARIAASERRGADAMAALETAQRNLEARLAAIAADDHAAREAEALRGEMERRIVGLQSDLAETAAAARVDLEQQIASAVRGLEEAAERTAAMTAANLDALNRRCDELGEGAAIEIKRLAESLERRMARAEVRSSEAHARGEENAARLGAMEGTLRRSMKELGEALAAVSARVEERAGAAERRAAEALETVGAQVVDLADRLDTRQRTLLRDMAERLADAERRASVDLQSTAAELRARLDALEARGAETGAAKLAAPAAPTAPVSPAAGPDPWAPPPVSGPEPATAPIPTPEPPMMRDLSEEDHREVFFLEDFADTNPAPRYDFVDALDAELAANPEPPPITPSPDALVEELLTAPIDTPPPWRTEAEQPIDPATLSEELFDRDAPGLSVSEERPEREPSYLAAARRAAQARGGDKGEPATAKKSSGLVRAALWGATAVAVGSTVYALSRSRVETPPPPEAPSEEAAREASRTQSVLDAAAARLAARQAAGVAAQPAPLADASDVPLEPAATLDGPALDSLPPAEPLAAEVEPAPAPDTPPAEEPRRAGPRA